ncbi:MAG: hypothetical protein HLUCCA04_00790 [Oceanicaulis sp. HLUCCA04]|nr:MAG: hypothetical protein HLUCCA04_00790 [Oceanicaulis sp. HLUCCA04]
MSAVKAGEAFAVYGLLRRGASGFAQFGLETAFKPLGPCRIPGIIYDLGGYPGLVAGPGEVIGELFTVTDAAVIPRLDTFEEYYPDDLNASRYLRQRVHLLSPDSDAWVYVWNRTVAGCPCVESGDWLEWAGRTA